jgi:hypothetical protein
MGAIGASACAVARGRHAEFQGGQPDQGADTDTEVAGPIIVPLASPLALVGRALMDALVVRNHLQMFRRRVSPFQKRHLQFRSDVTQRCIGQFVALVGRLDRLNGDAEPALAQAASQSRFQPFARVFLPNV